MGAQCKHHCAPTISFCPETVLFRNLSVNLRI